jgi:GNAT superfamily N-acetyltransferase
MNASDNIRFESYRGAQIADLMEALGRLRIAVFRAFPYLYEGNLDYERSYLETYVKSARSLCFATWAGAEMIGATTCIPLADETEEVRRPFIDAEMAIEEICYFGESILLPDFRGQGIGHRFFDAREDHARALGFKRTCFCAVVRPEDHPLRPANYQTLDEFWKKRGYRPVPELVSSFEWPDIGETESTAKAMTYWMREL